MNERISDMSKEPDFHSNEALTHAQFLHREYNISHLTFEKEFAFYNAVKDGNLNEVRRLMVSLHNEQLGCLSDNPLCNLKYHLIITIALITRFCIEGGMLPENAYTLSDVYIRKLDKCENEMEIDRLHEVVITDYTKKMKKLKKETVFSKPVIQVMDYVYEHLHEKIKLGELAESLGLNKTYLCGLFKKETGMTIGEYSMKRRLEAAQNMLVFSDYSSVDISNYFAFSSHSHFISAFKKETGMTPKQYREFSYRIHFTKPSLNSNN